MGACRYCGKPVGLFRKQHSECAQRNDQADSKKDLDILSDVHQAMIRALSKGVSQQDFVRTERKRLDNPKLLRLIYNSYLRVSLAADQWKRIEETRESHPYLLYQLGPSRVHHPEHERWDGILLPATNAWWETHFPPNEWGCRCWVRQVSRVEAKRKGWRVRRKLLDRYYTTTDPITGGTIRLPEGIGPGWNVSHKTKDLARLQKYIVATFVCDDTASI